jgi:hypothetical protein
LNKILKIPTTKLSMNAFVEILASIVTAFVVPLIFVRKQVALSKNSVL